MRQTTESTVSNKLTKWCAKTRSTSRKIRRKIRRLDAQEAAAPDSPSAGGWTKRESWRPRQESNLRPMV